MGTERSSNVDLIAPPVGFTVYDVSVPWMTESWIASIDDAVGTPVWLGHKNIEGDSSILVGTAPRAEFAVVNDLMLTQGASSPLYWLMSVVEPGVPGGIYSAVGISMWRHLGELVESMEDWPVVTWSVQARPVRAAVLNFGGAWMAITDDLDEVYLAVVGFGCIPDSESFVVTCGHDYGVDFAQPFTMGKFNRTRVWQMPQPHEHPDFRRFLRG